MVSFAGKYVWSIPERLGCEPTIKALYKSTLAYLYLFAFALRKYHWQSAWHCLLCIQSIDTVYQTAGAHAFYYGVSRRQRHSRSLGGLTLQTPRRRRLSPAACRRRRHRAGERRTTVARRRLTEQRRDRSDRRLRHVPACCTERRLAETTAAPARQRASSSTSSVIEQAWRVYRRHE